MNVQMVCDRNHLLVNEGLYFEGLFWLAEFCPCMDGYEGKDEAELCVCVCVYLIKDNTSFCVYVCVFL